MGCDYNDGRTLRNDCFRDKPLLTYGGHRTEPIRSF